MNVMPSFYAGRFDSSFAGGVRWFDQKVTFGNIAEVANAVLSTVTLGKLDDFTRKDIQNSASFNNAIQRDYGKPSLTDESAANEYDKFISQNLIVLAYSGILSSATKNGKKRIYKIRDREMLERIAGNEKESREFLIEYIEWVLKQFGWWSHVKRYIESEHSQTDMDHLKDAFTNLAIDTMKLGSRGSARPEVEAGRIFNKVINLVAYANLVPGIERGRVMKTPPRTFELSYNRPNWRDIASKKPKRMTRKAYEEQLEQAAASSIVESVMTSAMRKVKNYQQGVSEVPDSTGVKATHIHHMFPKHAFPDLADMLENLIALTPGQHLGIAHPDGNTQKIDLVFQRTCLNQKLESIKKSIDEDEDIYSYENFATVLQIGWGIDRVEPTYSSLRQAIVEHLA